MDTLSIIANNPALFKAVQDLFKKQFSIENIPHQGDNESVGQYVRVRLDGTALLEAAFKEIERHRTPETKPPIVNPAR